jgi:hypothetical protein
MLASVWSSLFTVMVAALGILVSSSMTSLYVRSHQHESGAEGEKLVVDVLLLSILEDKQLEPVGRVHLSTRLESIDAYDDEVSARPGSLGVVERDQKKQWVFVNE